MASKASSLLSVSDRDAVNFGAWPFFAQDEMDAATRVLVSGKVNYWTGNEGREFEREYAKHTTTQYGVAVANGSLALELALRVLGVGPETKSLPAHVPLLPPPVVPSPSERARSLPMLIP